MSRSLAGAWNELGNGDPLPFFEQSRSLAGAWIEILYYWAKRKKTNVAPLRERGLKCAVVAADEHYRASRSLAGAWIEIPVLRSSIK